MARYTRKREEEIGLSPNALVFRGVKKVEQVSMQLIDYSQDEVTRQDIHTVADLLPMKDTRQFVWLNINGLHDATMMECIGQTFNIPLNVLSDIMNPEIRPKSEEFEGGIFITLKSFRYHKRGNRLSIDNISLVLLHNTLISFQEEPGTLFDPVRERLRKSSRKMRTEGCDYLAFALLDVIIDHYIYIAGILGEKIEQLEDQLYDWDGNANRELLQQSNHCKHELSFFRKHVRAAREMVAGLLKSESDSIHAKNKLHFRELLNNVKEADDVLDTYREMLYDLMNMYHTSVGERLNDIMKVLAIISVIFIPITFIAGVYGTNFDYLPELHWRYSYAVMWAVMIVIVALMLWYFKRKKWW